jgi:phage baseplate assembly protein W
VSDYSTLNPNYGVVSMELVLHDSEAIESEIENCLGISIGEYWFEPTFGANLRRYLMEPVDDITASDIWMEVINRIAIWMPNISILAKSGVQANAATSSFTIILNYSINKSGTYGSFIREISN